MRRMRALVTLAALALAAPAAAQDLSGLNSFQLDALLAQQQLDRMRAISQHNEIVGLEARLKADQFVRWSEAARQPTVLPQLPYPAPPAAIDVSKLPSIPEAALADSNRRVRDIVQNRR